MKKLAAFLIALPALIFLTLFKILPAIQTVILSFKDYNIFKGIFASEPAGFANYAKLFQIDIFPGIIKNTVMISSLSILFTCVLAVLLILCISRLPNWILKSFAIALIAIPAFIPAASYVSVFFDIFSMDGIINSVLTPAGAEPRLLFADPGIYPCLAAFMDAIRSAYVPVIIGVLVCETRNRESGAGRIGFVMMGYIAARAMMLMSPDMESMMLTVNPLNRQSAEVIDTLSYRFGLMNMQISLASALWVIKTFIQMVISFTAFFLLYLAVPRITELTGRLGEGKKTVSGSVLGVIGFVIFGAASALMIISTFMPAKGDIGAGIGMLMNDRQFSNALMNSLTSGLIICAIYGVMTFILAYLLNFSKIVYPLFLVMIFSLSNNFVGENLFEIKMANTVVPVIINSVLSVAGAFALHFSVAGRLKGAVCGFGQYFRLALAPLTVIVVLAFIANWGSFFYQNIFLADISEHGVGSYVYQMIWFQGQNGADVTGGVHQNAADLRAAAIFISSAIPAALGALLIFLNKFLPLTAFSANIKKS